jgi:hypothetical protein
MNIFHTDPCPRKSAQALCSKRVIKMILESAQMLSTALHFHGCDWTPYKPTHINHPSNLWTRQTKTNYLWLLEHMTALSEEYTYRYGKVHKSAQFLEAFKELSEHIPEGELTPFANCAANQEHGVSFKHLTDTCEAYRLYLNERWRRDKKAPSWGNRTEPEWRVK